MNVITILWADDEIDLFKPSIMFLENKGYKVIPVTNGKDAIDLVAENGIDVVFLDESHPQFTGEERMFTSYRQKKVKSSTGQEQLRYFVNGSIRLGDLEYTTEFSLTRRNGMRHPILLGRKLLNRRFVVDPSRKNITRKSSK